ncbi:MAG: hypothetical protein ACLFSQ_04850 [Candidatus Zixiibacteriota bacterium]
MKKLILIAILITIFSIAHAEPFEGYRSDVLDSMYFNVKTSFTLNNHYSFFAYNVDSMQLLNEDDDSLEYSGWQMRAKIAVHVYWGLDIVADLPYKSITMVDNSVNDSIGEISSTGLGDTDFFIKYRPVTSESPIVLMIGATVPLGDKDAEPSLGDDYINGHIGILNTKEFRGFELSTNLIITLTGLNKDRSVFGNYARYIGTAEAPVLMNGRRIGSLSGEIKARVGEEINKKYMVSGTVGLEYRPIKGLIIQGGVNFPILDSDTYPRRKVSPVITAQFRL